MSEYVGYIEYTIPAGTYNGQDADISTLATGQFIATDRDNFTEDEMYALMCDIFDNREEWVVSHRDYRDQHRQSDCSSACGCSEVLYRARRGNSRRTDSC